MQDYEALDLSAYCNVGRSFLAEVKHVLIGTQVFHGLPFLIGGKTPDEERCLIGLGGEGGGTEPVSVPIGRKARYVIFAHLLLESKIEAGGPVGRPAGQLCCAPPRRSRAASCHPRAVRSGGAAEHLGATAISGNRR